MKNLGTILFIAAIGMMAFSGFHIMTKKEVITTRKINVQLAWCPIIGTGLFVAGILIVVLGKKS